MAAKWESTALRISFLSINYRPWMLAMTLRTTLATSPFSQGVPLGQLCPCEQGEGCPEGA